MSSLLGGIGGSGSLSVLWGMASVEGNLQLIDATLTAGVLYNADGSSAASGCTYTNLDIRGLGISISTTELWGETGPTGRTPAWIDG